MTLSLLLFGEGAGKFANAETDQSTPAFTEILFRFEVEREEMLAPVKELRTKYDGALERLEKKVQAAGKLDQLLAVKKERSEFRKKGLAAEGAFPELLKLRDIYEEELSHLREKLDEDEKQLIGHYVELLEVEKVGLTKEGKFDDALKVSESIELLNKGDFVGTQAAPGSLIWKFTDLEQVLPVKDCLVEPVDDIFVLSLPPGTTSAQIETRETFSPPFEARFRVATNSTNIRIYFASFLTILNHESGRTALQVYDPKLGRSNSQMIPNKGRVATEEFHEIELGVLKDRYYLIINDELCAEGQGDYSGLDAAIGIGPAYGSQLKLHRFEIHRP